MFIFLHKKCRFCIRPLKNRASIPFYYTYWKLLENLRAMGQANYNYMPGSKRVKDLLYQQIYCILSYYQSKGMDFWNESNTSVVADVLYYIADRLDCPESLIKHVV